jgi:hypothetical protein
MTSTAACGRGRRLDRPVFDVGMRIAHLSVSTLSRCPSASTEVLKRACRAAAKDGGSPPIAPWPSTDYEQLASNELENAHRSTDRAIKRSHLDQAAVFATLAENNEPRRRVMAKPGEPTVRVMIESYKERGSGLFWVASCAYEAVDGLQSQGPSAGRLQSAEQRTPIIHS